jgi:tRNA threonylcarbamoyladenosine biosynthesis protein TsaB
MKTLAIEFSSERRSVAVSLNGMAPVEAHVLGNHGAGALALVEEALRRAGCEREDIDTLAIGIGPGSYAGIRSAIALAQGWQLARPVRLLAIESVECLAAQAHTQGLRGVVNAVVDAQRGEFYLGRFDLGPETWRPLEPLRLAGRSEIESGPGRGETIIGPEVNQWFKEGKAMYPDASTLALLATHRRRELVDASGLAPIYLRPVTFVKAPPPRTLPAVK